MMLHAGDLVYPTDSGVLSLKCRDMIKPSKRVRRHSPFFGTGFENDSGKESMMFRDRDFHC